MDLIIPNEKSRLLPERLLVLSLLLMIESQLAFWRHILSCLRLALNFIAFTRSTNKAVYDIMFRLLSKFVRSVYRDVSHL